MYCIVVHGVVLNKCRGIPSNALCARKKIMGKLPTGSCFGFIGRVAHISVGHI